MRSLGGTPTEFTKLIGAVPAVMPPPEMYQQLEKKVLDGWSIDWQAVKGFKLTEITPYIYRFNSSFYHSMNVIVMNEDSYAKIPDKYKERLIPFVEITSPNSLPEFMMIAQNQP